MVKKAKKVTGYDKYVDWKIFNIPVILLFVLLLIPTPNGMKDVGMEYRIGPKAVIDHFTQVLFGTDSAKAEQWQLLTAQIMEQNMTMGVLSRGRYLNRDLKWCRQNKIKANPSNFDQAHGFIDTQINDADFLALMQGGLALRKDGLKYEHLSAKDRAEADKGAWAIKVSIAMAVFVVLCFLTECIPLPGVAFCIGLILSDHALAAMFLPIGMLLYPNSLTKEIPEDPELGKMLMISIAMACNIGGPGAPSGGARNVIMMTYLNDMFGMDIGYLQWMTYCFPFLLVMIPVTWLMVNWRFKPAVTSL